MSNKNDLEFNKIFASILVAGLVAMLAGFATNLLYPTHNYDTEGKEVVRGYQIEIAETSPSTQVESEPEIIDIAALMADASIEKGAKVAKKCAACHSFNAGGAHKVGPNLYNIINAQIASKEGYSYSGALSSIDKKWTYEEIFAFLEAPKKYAPGTKMSFAGLRKPKDIANLVKFLESHGE